MAHGSKPTRWGGGTLNPQLSVVQLSRFTLNPKPWHVSKQIVDFSKVWVCCFGAPCIAQHKHPAVFFFFGGGGGGRVELIWVCTVCGGLNISKGIPASPDCTIPYTSTPRTFCQLLRPPMINAC